MADEFRRGLDARCGVGGVKCYCCNDWNKGHDDKRRLRKLVRTEMKRKDLTEFNKHGIPKEE